MSKRIDTQARIEAVRLQNQGAAPSAPASGYSLIFTKSDGLYLENASGTVIGPFITGTTSQAAGIPSNGWVSDANTWSYLSSDAPSYVASVNANITGSVGLGDRVWLSQFSTSKYFIVTSESVSGSTTYLNLYGGTDYSLTTGSISSPYYSPVKAPFGFPLSPTKWTVSVSDATQQSQSSPNGSTWYNLGSIQISIPIGVWNVLYQNAIQVSGNQYYQTLSTANNSESDTGFTCTGLGGIMPTQMRFKVLALTSKTVYYLNAKAASSSFVQTRGDASPTILSAICAYL